MGNYIHSYKQSNPIYRRKSNLTLIDILAKLPIKLDSNSYPLFWKNLQSIKSFRRINCNYYNGSNRLSVSTGTSYHFSVSTDTSY